jgi:protein farnesyltransferase subunit beta
MPIRAPLRNKRRKIQAKSNNMASPQNSRLDELRASSIRYEDLPERRVVELSDSDNDYEDMGTATPAEAANITYLQSVTIPITDTYETETSATQEETLEVVLPFLQGNPNDFPLSEFGLPLLQRPKHIRFLSQCLGDYPAMMSVMDASRPWLVYWSLAGMSALGDDISGFQDR